jgi:hypothetical protein
MQNHDSLAIIFAFAFLAKFAIADRFIFRQYALPAARCYTIGPLPSFSSLKYDLTSNSGEITVIPSPTYSCPATQYVTDCGMRASKNGNLQWSANCKSPNGTHIVISNENLLESTQINGYIDIYIDSARQYTPAIITAFVAFGIIFSLAFSVGAFVSCCYQRRAMSRAIYRCNTALE